MELQAVAKQIVRHIEGREQLNPLEVKERRGRVVKVFDGGLRQVLEYYGDGESWRKMVIMPRALLLNVQRELRTKGVGRQRILSLIPGLGCEYYGGPGRGFVELPWIYTRNRRFVVAYQRGGLDV